MISTYFFYKKECHVFANPPLFLIVTVLYTITLSGCLLDYDLQDGNISSSHDDYDGFDAENDTDVTSPDDGTTVTPSDSDSQVADEDSDTEIHEEDSETGVTPKDTETESSTEDDPQESYATFCEEGEEKDYVFLECGLGGTIFNIDFASFGQYEGSCAGGNATIGKCHFDGTKTVIEALCLGRSRCRLIADKKDVFDEPCKKDDHFLIAKYTCRYETVCPQSSLKSVPGKCGCNIPDYDRDGDGSADCNDQCDNDPFKIVMGQCGCGIEEKDKDEDGVPSCVDNCDNDPRKTEPGLCGCGKTEDDIDDRDGDGTIDCKDKCPTDPKKKDPGDCGCGRADTFLCLF